MALSPGSRLGVYDVIAPIGEGGMGAVFRARDTKLNRDVALKILSDAFASDPDRLARFTREAQTLASLNHPNIAHIHGLEESGSVRALVMELVEGDDLSQRLMRGAVPLEEALPIARQIAEALEAAHEQGIVHRDLKPANIKVRSDGMVKVLDFGLAKALEQSSGLRDAGTGGGVTSPTLTSPAMMTGVGMILGTAAYMAPEQAKGRAVDKRADVWAFGVVLHEMLTGRRLFDAEDMSETLAAVLTRDVSLTTLPAAVPARLRTLLRACLVRDPRQRLRDIGDARIALEQILAGAPDDPSAALTAAPAPVRSRALPWLSAAVLAFAAALLIAWAPWRVHNPPDRPLVRLDVDLGAGVALPPPGQGRSSAVISNDGTRIAYASGTPTKLFTRRLDQTPAAVLPGTTGATAPFFSPDGRWIGFVAGGKLNKISVDGGAIVPLSDGADISAASWGEDGAIVVAAFQKLLRFPVGGGQPVVVAEPTAAELSLVQPDILPGGKAILFAADNPGPVNQTTIDVITLTDHRRKTLVRGGASPRYLAAPGGIGYLLYITNATLFAIAFDPERLETRGTAVPVVDDVAHESLIGAGQFDVSSTGTLVYRRTRGDASELTTLQSLTPAGRREALPARAANYRSLSVSPDGTRIALTLAPSEGVSQDVWLYDPRRDSMTRLTFGGGVYNFPVWSPDGRSVIFASVGNGILAARADGSNPPQLLTQSKHIQYPFSFTPDGKRLAYYEAAATPNVWTMALEEQGGHWKPGPPEPFAGSHAVDTSPSFSPDGRWLAYQSNESGTPEVYVRAFPPPAAGQGGRWQISNNGGTAPRWSRTGRELVYQSGDQLMTASYRADGGTFVAEPPRVWIAKLGAASISNGTAWAVAPDGAHVLLLAPVVAADLPPPEHDVVFLQNFLDELRRRVPLRQ